MSTLLLTRSAALEADLLVGQGSLPVSDRSVSVPPVLPAIPRVDSRHSPGWCSPRLRDLRDPLEGGQSAARAHGGLSGSLPAAKTGVPPYPDARPREIRAAPGRRGEGKRKRPLTRFLCQGPPYNCGKPKRRPASNDKRIFYLCTRPDPPLRIRPSTSSRVRRAKSPEMECLRHDIATAKLSASPVLS